MNVKKQLLIAFMISLFSVVIFGLIAIQVNAGKVVNFDATIISFIQGFESPTLTKIMKFFSWVGSGIPLTVIVLVISTVFFIFLKYRSELIFYVFVVLGSYGLNEVLKSLFHRDRPILHRLAEAGGFSFPSGHSMIAVAFYSALTFLLWRHISTRLGRTILIFISVFFILAIGISRIYLGVHYPSDVIGGYFASGFFVATSIWFYQRYREKRSK